MKLLIILIFLVSVTSAAAEEISQELDQIVVTASRVEEKLKEAPVTINVLDSAEIEKIKYRNPSDILRRIPGIYSHDFGGESEITSIRVQTHFTNPYTIVLLDGVPISSYGSGSSGQFAELNSDNISHIEVIKGPASALYGSNAIGGVINVISKDPTAKPQMKFWSEYGKGEHWRSGISGSGSGEKVSFNIDLNHIDSEGWRDHSSLNKKTGNIKLQYLPTDESLFSLKLDCLTSENDTPGSLYKADFESDWQHSYYDVAYSKTDKIAPSLSYTYFFDEAEFKTTLALRDIDSESLPHYNIRQRTWGPFPRPYEGKFNQSENKAANLQFLYSRDFTVLNSKIIVGLDTERGSLDSDSYDITVTWDAAQNKYTSYTMGDLDKSYDITTKVYAPFIQLQASPFDKLKLTAGGRYDSAEYELGDKQDHTNDQDKKFTQFSPKFGLTYDFTPWFNSYFSYSKGFVVPTTGQLFTASSANSNLEPEKADNVEVGIRSSFWQNKLALDVALYSMEISDKIVSDSFFDPYLNVGETSQKGLEATAVLLPVDKVKLSMAYSYARNKYEIYSADTPEYNGNWVRRSPKHRFNARLAVMPIKGLEVELEMDMVSSQYHDSANLFEYSRPTLFNLRANYSWEQWSFWCHIKNLTDETYATYVSGDTTASETSFYPGAPISFFVGVSYKWGK